MTEETASWEHAAGVRVGGRAVFYMAAPVRPDARDLAEVVEDRVRGQGEYELDYSLPMDDLERRRRATRENCYRALRWLRWLRASFSEITFIAPWIVNILGGGDDDNDPLLREAGLRDACAIVERCDGVVLCGGRISSGMTRELEHGMRMVSAFHVVDLTAMGREPPPDLAAVPLEDYALLLAGAP